MFSSLQTFTTNRSKIPSFIFYLLNSSLLLNPTAIAFLQSFFVTNLDLFRNFINGSCALKSPQIMVSMHPSFVGRASVYAYFGNEMIIVLFFSLKVYQFGNNYWSPYLLASILP